MKHFFVAGIVLVLTVAGFAQTDELSQRQIVVMTSITSPDKLPFWKRSFDAHAEIEKRFMRGLAGSGYNLAFIHNATMEQLDYYLRADDTLALFWVAHANGGLEGSGPANISSVITDIHGNNVKNIFQHPNKNLKFLSIVGCNALSTLQGFSEKGYFHNELIFHSFDKKKFMGTAIRGALKAAAQVLDEEGKYRRLSKRPLRARQDLIDGPYLDSEPTNSTNEIQLEITNTNPEHSAILTVNKEFIGLLSPGTHKQYFSISPKFGDLSRIKIRLQYDRRILEIRPQMNPLDILTNTDRDVSYLRNQQGQPYNANLNIYYLTKENS